VLSSFIFNLATRHRRTHRPGLLPAFDSPLSTRSASLPPDAPGERRIWRLRDWLSTFSPNAEEVEWLDTEPPSQSLLTVRHDFDGAIGDLTHQRAGDLAHRIRSAHSTLELWHLRPELFTLVSMCHDQVEAQRRLDRLNRHFPLRAVSTNPSDPGRPS
jgi:hypothetical protein